MSNEEKTPMTEAKIKSIAQSAAREAVREMMREFGLNDEHAPKDIHELRNLLSSWRMAKKTIFQTIVRATTTFALGALALGAWLKFKGMK